MPIRAFNPKVAAVLGAAIALALVGGLFYIGYFGNHDGSDCQEYPLQTVFSPSGTLKAQQEQEACASTGQLRTTVTIARAGGERGSEAPATVFSAVSGNALGAMATGQRSLALGLHWEGDGALMITHPSSVQPQFPPGAHGGVTVRYEVTAARPQ
jgi:hypothetical protein